jgi:hypothetical protein
MRIRYELFLATAVAFTLCLALPAEAAKKQRAKAPAPTAYAASTSCPGATWGSAGRGLICNGPDYIGQDPDVSIRAYILKDLGLRYGGAF